MTDSSDAFNLDLALASLDADASDNQLMFKMLVERLAGALGDRLRIERAGLMRKNGPIRKLEIQITGALLIAELGDSAPSFFIGRVSGGIRIRTDQTDASGWLRALLEALNLEAEHSSTVRQALETIIIGGN
jgi:hypothetical protein